MDKLVVKNIAQNIKEELKLECKDIKPTLAIIMVGNNSASSIYVKNKIKDCEEVGINSILIHKEDMTEKELLNEIDILNKNSDVDGIIVQLPLPRHIKEERIIHAIDINKDVDGFNYYSPYKSCTPQGVIEILKRSNIKIEGEHVVIIGRSNIVGKPLSRLMLDENATITICHSKTKNIKEITLTADIVVVAVGISKFLKADMIKKDATVIDVGINYVDGKIIGDVEYEEVCKVAKFVTPVPGGVGIMTRLMLLKNVLNSKKVKI